ncbi:methionine--tRNA ligase subunit beta [bacterium]|nr:methionine--tRNA ligase subunit beta [candidate division CSSED10-310 bacterium]
MDCISYDDFKKLDVRIGTVLSAEPVEGADRLICLRVDIGEPEPRQIVAGLREYYAPGEMVGRQIVVLTNLQPRKMRGIISNGMLLAASTEDFSRVKLLTVDEAMPPGSHIS